MTLVRLIAPKWLEETGAKRAIEGKLTDEQIAEYNAQGYNVYFFPNYPSQYEKGTNVDASQIDVFTTVMVDFDTKPPETRSKADFLNELNAVPPTAVADSGNGIHAYYTVSDLDAKSYLRLTRRIMRLFNTDPAVGTLNQLMRLPGTLNTKKQDNYVFCEELITDGPTYTAEELDQILPPITPEDEAHCQRHYDMAYNIQGPIDYDDALPPKFGKLLETNPEAKEIWGSITNDRSKSDYRLGHLMFANGFSKSEAMSVLVNSAKALTRAPVHRAAYATNIIEKIWTYELAEAKDKPELSESVESILNRSGNTLKGVPFRCSKWVDDTHHGFRLTQVIGMVAGSGVGKTATCLNFFRWFVETNPDYTSFFVSLEQPANEIADRWKTQCGDRTDLHSKVHIISNYNEDGSFRHLSFEDIKAYIMDWQQRTGKKAGCVVIDHIGALKKKGKNGENQDLMDICHAMKAFAVETNTLLVMQSQAPREKAGIGDLELNKDAAYGTVFFESYCDYLISIWQPLKRCHMEEGCPTVTAFKFCKIRHKKAHLDRIQEDVCYRFYFDPNNETLRPMTQVEETAFDFYIQKATNKRKGDRKTDLVEYKSVPAAQDAERRTNSH